MKMNEKQISREELAALRKAYQPGTEVELVQMDDPYCDMPVGLRGWVAFVDDSGSIHVDWQNGSSLAAVYGVDSIRRVPVIRYLDKHGEEIKAGMQIRHLNGEIELVYDTADDYGNADLGISATNPAFAALHPTWPNEYYSLNSFNLNEWEIIKK